MTCAGGRAPSRHENLGQPLHPSRSCPLSPARGNHLQRPEPAPYPIRAPPRKAVVTGRLRDITTSGNITDDIIMRYLDRHTHKQGFCPSQ